MVFLFKEGGGLRTDEGLPASLSNKKKGLFLTDSGVLRSDDLFSSGEEGSSCCFRVGNGLLSFCVKLVAGSSVVSVNSSRRACKFGAVILFLTVFGVNMLVSFFLVIFHTRT